MSSFVREVLQRVLIGGGQEVDRATVTTVSALGTLQGQLNVKLAIVGTYSGDGTDFDITDINVDGDTVTFDMVFVAEGTQIPVSFKGTLDGASLTGEFTSDIGTAQVTASKADTAATGGGDDQAVVAAMMQDAMNALVAQDIDLMVSRYSDDFTSDQGGGVAEMKEFLNGAKEQGFLEDIEYTLDNMEITITDNTASVESLEIEGAFGALTLEFELEKRDGEWFVTYQAQY